MLMLKVKSYKTKMPRNNKSTTETLRSDSRELLAVPEVAQRLGDYGVRLSGVVDRLSHIEVDSTGFMEMRDKHIDDIPLVLRHLGQHAVLHAKDSYMNGLQLSSLTVKLGAEKARVAERKTKQHFMDSQSHRELSIFKDEKGLAITGSNFWLPKQDTIAYGRPYMSMNVDTVHDKLSPVVALHEYVHVLQKEDSPIGRVEALERNKVRHELEAYYVAAQIILGMKDAGRQRELLEHTSRHELERALKIESVRTNSQMSEDPFDPNNDVVKSMVDNNLGITAEVDKVVRNKSAK
jgi:hypothetical protein